MSRFVFLACLAVLLVVQPSTQQTIPVPDLSCINTQFIMKTVNCYIAGLGSMFVGGDDPVEPEPTQAPSEGNTMNINIRITGFTGTPDHVSPIRQTPTPGAEHLDLIYEHLQAAKSSLQWAAESFHRGMMSEAKTQEEIMKVLAFEKDLLKQLSEVDEREVTEFIANSIAKTIADFQMTLRTVRSLIEEHITEEMVAEHGLGGTDDLEDNIPDWILAIVCGVEPRVCTGLDVAQIAIDCLNNYTRDDFENGLKWVKCFYNCKMVNYAVPCVNEVFDSCGGIAWVGDVLNKGLIQYLELDHCIVQEMLPPDDTTLLDIINGDLPPGVMPYDFIVAEGDDAIPIKVANNMPPASMCFDFGDMLGSTTGLVGGVARILTSYLFTGKICSANFEVWTSNYMDAVRGHNIVHEIPFTDDFVFGGPMCRNGYLLSQLKIAEHGYNVDGENQCKIKLDRDNWNGNITIPVRATADMKNDGDQDVFMTIKLVLGGIHASTMRAKILVQNNDVDIPKGIHEPNAHSVCRSTSDPHMTTFDGTYYNNMYLGYFVLYRQRNLPYEVQIIYQTCQADQTSQATCNCGVAVRSGDDVFVAERCRRDDGLDQPLRSQLYLNGDLTQGTFIFSEYDGQRYHIVLPHGETVRIVVDEHPNVINVMVKPSAFDFGNGRTEGLCGQHTGSGVDDYLMPDGSIYLGEGTGEGEIPFGFIEAYRVGEANLMFEGAFAMNGDVDVGTYCRCHFMPILGPQCRCDSNIVEMCDMVVGDDVTATFVSSALPSNPGQGLDGVTLDAGFVPDPMPSWDDSEIGENNARKDCDDYSREHEMVKEFRKRVCPLIGSCNPNERVEFGCMDDILLTQDYQWMRTTREAVKDEILDRETSPLLKTEFETKVLSDLMCLNDCNDNGVCVEAQCVCNNGFTGATCDVSTAAKVTIKKRTELCDLSRSECSMATVTGFNFSPSTKCHLRKINPTSSGPQYAGTLTTSDAVFISQTQVSCKVPKGSSYAVSVSEKSEDSVYFIAYDGNTTHCDATTASCTSNKATKVQKHARKHSRLH